MLQNPGFECFFVGIPIPTIVRAFGIIIFHPCAVIGFHNGIAITTSITVYFNMQVLGFTQPLLSNGLCRLRKALFW